MKQKGLAPILIVLLIALGLGGYLIYQKQIKPVSVPQQTSELTPVPASSSESTNAAEVANWKMFQETSSDGFGYEVKVPPNWDSTAFTWGEGSQPLPKELARSFFDKTCGLNKGKVTILHFLSNDPQKDIKQNVSGLEKDGFKISTLKTETGITISKLSGNLVGTTDYYAYFPSTKGYYYVSGRDECVNNYAQNFDQILSTFKFTNEDQAILDTTGWKTYTSEIGRFTIRYPDEWMLVSNPECQACLENIEINLISNSSIGVGGIGVYGLELYPNAKTINEYVDKYLKNNSSIGSIKFTTIGNKRAVAYRYLNGIEPLNIINYSVIENNRYYVMGLEGIPEIISNKDKNIQLFNQMLSTLTFLP